MYLNSYLPSKEFQKRLLAITLIVLSVLAIYAVVKLIGRGIDSYKVRKQIRQLPAELRDQADTLTVGELQTKDSNNNGIYDWEERLYGLDPLADGANNKNLVTEKRNSLKDSSSEYLASASVGETNDFTREFLSLVTSLSVSGALNDEAVNNVASAIGGKLISNDQPEIYPRSDFIVVRDTEVTRKEYQRLSELAINKLSTLPMLGYEMEFLSESIRGSDPSLLSPLDNISSTYKSFSGALLKIPVPENLLQAHKALVNSSEYVGRSLLMVQMINTDPMVALQGIAMYNTHFIIMNASLDELAAGLNL